MVDLARPGVGGSGRKVWTAVWPGQDGGPRLWAPIRAPLRVQLWVRGLPCRRESGRAHPTRRLVRARLSNLACCSSTPHPQTEFDPKGGIIITENGVAVREDSLADALKDVERAVYLKAYLRGGC